MDKNIRKKKFKGFTLIELLAVVVILAIISLIATPTVLNIIDNTKASAKLRSAELYMDSVSKAIVHKNLTTTISDTECEVQSNGNLLCDDILIEIDVDKEKPTEGTIVIKNGQITNVSGLKIDTSVYSYDDNKTLVKALKVTFNTNSEDTLQDQYIVPGKKISDPGTLVKNGYRFVEWQFNGSTYNFDTLITDDMTLTAVWEQIPTHTLITGQNFNTTIKTLVKGSTVSSYSTEDSTVEKIEFYSLGTLPENYTLETLTALPSVSVSETANKVNAYYDSSTKSVYIYSDDIIAWNDNSASMFSYFTKLDNFVIPNNVTSIKNYTFQNCTGLKNVTIPEGVTSVGMGAFSSSGLTSITFPESLTSIGYNSFSGTNVTSLVIPATITEWSEGAFQNCNELTSVTLEDGVTKLGKKTFWGCDKLENVNLGNTLTHLPEKVLADCPKLTSITIPNSVTSIGERAFNGCTKLSTIVFGNNITQFGSYAFSGCTSLTSMTIPDSVTWIGTATFSSCTNLRTIVIGSGVKKYI